MGNEIIEINIGQWGDILLDKVKQSNLSDSAKQKVINFWNNDKDGCVTNEIEKSMLDSFIRESSVVTLPNGDPELLISADIYNGSALRQYVSESNSEKPEKSKIQKAFDEAKKHIQKVRDMFKDGGFAVGLTVNGGNLNEIAKNYDLLTVDSSNTKKSVMWENTYAKEKVGNAKMSSLVITDKLVDKDGDGTADYRVYREERLGRQSAVLKTKLYVDLKLDGTLEEVDESKEYYYMGTD